ncbi:di-/tricarboxylate transporter [Desulfosporosinus orientis DSM 765]|uniref:Di-/tricarboxylate transporter n=1 Tax=Desulfosporosinus orientis (strain ATCC 19365 / DSM 765 / NCIMB 8382 / VKM B-1628 / Singapore I) TaxID=768706 RepID=G7WEL9_DESOD|nr:SLC13 family permease [Desulfosporosinus orientis]AET66910.1 di-/tricarboxylate transporter [Desulfosporosinus orientis DSM 765]
MSTALAPSPQGIDRKKLIYWILTIGLPVLVMFIPVNEAFTAQIRLFVAITLCAILIFAFETMDSLIPSILLPVAYVMVKLASANVVFSPWSLYIPWMFMGGMLMANVLDGIGILKRIAYWCIIKTGGTYNGILYGILVIGIILNLMIPSSAIIPLAAFTYGICKALDLGPSKEAAGIMIAGCFASLFPMFFFYNPNMAIIFGLGSQVTKISVSWVQYFIHGLPFVLWYVLMIFVISKVFKSDKNIDCKELISEEYKKLGKITKAEKKGLFVSLLLFIFLVTGNIHHIEVGWGFVFAACLMYFPGINIGTNEHVKKTNFPMVFFVTACMSIGSVANVIGVGKAVANALVPVMAAQGPLVTIVLIWLLCVGSNFLLTPLAIMATFTVPLTQVAINLGMNPLPIFYTIFQGIDQIVMPYEYALVLIFFSFGLIRLKDFIKIFSLKMVLNLVFLVVVMYPYWKLLGLL